MRAIALFSGGKDSAFAIESCLEDCVALAIFTGKNHSQFHAGPEIPHEILVAMQTLVSSRGLEAHIEPLGRHYMKDAVVSLRSLKDRYSADCLVTGDFWHPVTDQYSSTLAQLVGLKLLRPIKNYVSVTDYLSDLWRSGIDASILSVREGVLSPALIGKRLSAELLEEFPKSIDLSGENGEYQTIVTASKIYSGEELALNFSDELVWVVGRNPSEAFLTRKLSLKNNA